MRHYRCYFLIDDRIKAAEDIGAKDDADALLMAEELIAGSSFPAIKHMYGLSPRCVLRHQPTLELVEGSDADPVIGWAVVHAADGLLL